MKGKKKLFLPLILCAALLIIGGLREAEAEGAICIHKWVAATCTSPKKCSKCKATQGVALGHNYAAATCTSAKHCTRCGLTIGSPLGHNNTTTYTAATCTTGGYEITSCSRCGKTTKKMIQNPLGHIEVPGAAYNSEVPATCTTAGSHTYYCGRCKTKIRTSTIPKLGHKLTTTYTPVGCETPGYEITTCSRCSYNTKKIINNPIGHIEVPDAKYNKIVNPTCTKDGSHTYYCGRCSKELRTVSIPKTGHNMGWVTKKPASCTEAGYRNYECSKCGYVETSSTINKLEHKLTHAIVQLPRVHRDGIDRATCSDCGGHWDTAIAALPSTYILSVGLLGQDNNSCCGSCCAAMVCQYLRLNNSGSVSTLDFWEAVGHSTTAGSIANQLNSYLGLASSNGYAYHSLTAAGTSQDDFQDLMIRALKNNRPVLVQISISSTDKSLFGYTSGGHYILVTGIEESAGSIYAYVNDPFNGGYDNNKPSTHTGQKLKLSLSDLRRLCVNKFTNDNGSKWGAIVIDEQAFNDYKAAK